MRKVPFARGCSGQVEQRARKPQLRRSVEKDIRTEPVEIASRHDTEAIFERVAGQPPFPAQVGAQAERLRGAQNEAAADASVRSAHVDGVEVEPPARHAE